MPAAAASSTPLRCSGAGGPPEGRGRPRGEWLAAVLEDHRRRGRGGERVRVESYLERVPELRRDEEALLDLIHQEVLRREEGGEAPSLAEYVRRFPSLRAALEVQFSVLRAPEVDSVRGAGSSTPPGDDRPATSSFPTPREADIRPAVATGGGEAPRYPEVPGYEVLGVLGRGGMGVVYEARQKGLNRRVALKMIRDAALAGADDLGRFQAEAEALASLQHPHIVQVFEVSTADGLPFFSLEYVDGGSLADRLARTPQPPRWCAETLETLARAVAAAHARGIVHRDLKPANVLLTKDGTLKVTDFGLAKRLGAGAGQTCSGAVMGTPSYMAPEQARGAAGAIGPRSDLYALGVILYEMLTGRLPLVGENLAETLVLVEEADPLPPRRLQPKVPRDLETICLKCLRKDPAQRYAGAEALADDLRRFLNGEPVRARPVPGAERLVKWARRHPARAARAATAGALLAALLGALALRVEVLEQENRLTRVELAALQGRDEVRDQLLPPALSAMRACDWAGARAALARARARIQGDADAGPLRDHVEALLAKAREGERCQAEYARFEREADEAFFGEVRMAADRDALAKTRAAAVAALARYGVMAGSARPEPAVPAEYLTPDQQRRVRDRSWHLVFILAEAEASSLAGADSGDRLRRALALLDHLAAVAPASQSLHRQRAAYLDQLGLDAEARAARRRSPDQPVDPADFQQRGVLSLQAGAPEKAAPDFQEVLRREPRSFWALYWLALCEMQAAAEARSGDALARLAAAEAQLSLCVKERPDFAWAHILLADARAEQGKREAERLAARRAAEFWGRAEQDFCEAEKYHLDDEARYSLFTGRAALRVAQERYAEALADLEAARLKPRAAQSYLLRAHVHRQRREPDAALEQLDEAIRQGPEQASLYRARARQRLEMGPEHAAGALGDYEQALALEKRRGEVAALHLELGEALRRQRDFAGAVREYDAALALRPDLARAYLVRGEALYELAEQEVLPEARREQYERAARSADEYVRRGRPGANDYAFRATVRSRLALSLSTAGGPPGEGAEGPKRALDLYQGAVEDYSRALDLRPEAATYERRGWLLLLMMEAPKLALPDFRRAVEGGADDAPARAGRGLCLAYLGCWREAVADAEKALELQGRGKSTTFLTYNGARIYAQAAGRLAELPAPDAKARELRGQYQDRAVELVRRALEPLAPARRQAFWQESVRGDRALAPIRSSAAYRQLAQEYEPKCKN